MNHVKSFMSCHVLLNDMIIIICFKKKQENRKIKSNSDKHPKTD